MQREEQAEPAVSLESGYSLTGRGVGALRLKLPGPVVRTGVVTRLSPALVWFSPQEPLALRPRLALPSLTLEGEGTRLGPLRAEALWGAPRGHGAAVPLRLLGVSVEQGREMLGWLQAQARAGSAEPEASPLPVQEDIGEPERLRSVLTALCAGGARGRLRLLGRGGQVRLERVEAAAGTVWWRVEELEGEWGEAPCEIELVGYNSAYRLALPPVLRREGLRLVTALPTRLRRLRHRWYRRVAAPAGLRVRCYHPLWPELGLLEREVVDLGFGGLGLRVRPEDGLFPGLRLQPLELQAEGGVRVRLSAEVRHVSSLQGGLVCGLQVAPLTAQEEALWWRLVPRWLHPSTSGGEAPHEPRWAPHVSCQGVWSSPQEGEASLGSLKAYQHTWLLSPLERRAQGPRRLLGAARRDLYVRALEHAQVDPELRWALACLEDEDPWLEPVHARFARQHAKAGEVLLQPLRVWQARSNEPLATRQARLTAGQLTAGQLTVGQATPGERLQLTEWLARSRPACYVEALDLTLSRLDMEGVAGAWRRAGLERRRRILVARSQGEPVAAAVLESGPAGAPLPSPLEGVRLFSLSTWGHGAYGALLEEARAFFARTGRSAFRVLAEDESWQPPATAHLSPLGRAWLWLVPARLVPEFLEHVHERAPGLSALKA